jgi:hypothetical protein
MALILATYILNHVMIAVLCRQVHELASSFQDFTHQVVQTMTHSSQTPRGVLDHACYPGKALGKH